MVNGIDELAITNVDGLDTVETIKVCVEYRHGSNEYAHVPADGGVLAECKPIYVELQGWRRPTHRAKTWAELPLLARRYLKTIASLSGAKLKIASVGPAREQTIFL